MEWPNSININCKVNNTRTESLPFKRTANKQPTVQLNRNPRSRSVPHFWINHMHQHQNHNHHLTSSHILLELPSQWWMFLLHFGKRVWGGTLLIFSWFRICVDQQFNRESKIRSGICALSANLVFWKTFDNPRPLSPIRLWRHMMLSLHRNMSRP